MEKMIEAVKGLIEANKAIKQRTPWLDVALGGLLTALHNLEAHIKASNGAPPPAK